MINNEILGKWKVVKSEIPNYSVQEEMLDFKPNGVLIWSLDGHVLNYSYKVEDGTLTYKVRNDFVTVKIINDDPFLILEPSHKNRSWIARY